MTNYDPRRPRRAGDTGFRAGWIVVFIIILIIIGFGWRGGWYGTRSACGERADELHREQHERRPCAGSQQCPEPPLRP